MEIFDYAEFQAKIIQMHRGKENLPKYKRYIEAQLGGPESRLIRFTKLLVPEIQYHCGSLREKRLLDFGCGTGASTVALAQYSDSVCAFDVDSESLEICRHRLREHGMENKVRLYCAKDIEDIKSSMGTFDVILMDGVIEHIPLTNKGLRRKIIRVLFLELLNRSGYLIITDTPNRLWPIDLHTTQGGYLGQGQDHLGRTGRQ